MLEVQEPVMEPGPVVRHLKELEPMMLKIVEGDRSALCHYSWGWDAILRVGTDVKGGGTVGAGAGGRGMATKTWGRASLVVMVRSAH
jgi:hypothetical protein